jgi:hypothetical protein
VVHLHSDTVQQRDKLLQLHCKHAKREALHLINILKIYDLFNDTVNNWGHTAINERMTNEVEGRKEMVMA